MNKRPLYDCVCSMVQKQAKVCKFLFDTSQTDYPWCWQEPSHIRDMQQSAELSGIVPKIGSRGMENLLKGTLEVLDT